MGHERLLFEKGKKPDVLQIESVEIIKIGFLSYFFSKRMLFFAN
jgi:hypothetical protein